MVNIWRKNAFRLMLLSSARQSEIPASSIIRADKLQEKEKKEDEFSVTADKKSVEKAVKCFSEPIDFFVDHTIEAVRNLRWVGGCIFVRLAFCYCV